MTRAHQEAHRFGKMRAQVRTLRLDLARGSAVDFGEVDAVLHLLKHKLLQADKVGEVLLLCLFKNKD